MKKNLKFIIFTIIFAMICPVVFFACDDTKFEDVPYTSSSASLEDVVSDFNACRDYMINDITIRSEFETTNTYTFYDTQTSSAKKVKDVIKTTLGSLKDSPTIAIIDTTRYENDKKVYNTISTYVQPRSLESETPYCYSYTSTVKNEDEEVVVKDRNEYNPNKNLSLTDFYKQTIWEILPTEVSSIEEKEYEGVTYYKLNSGVTTLEAVNGRFFEETEDDTLEDNPQLFKIRTLRSHDAAENYYYECAKSGNYASYFKIYYNLKNNQRETYLNVVSETRLKGYGESVQTGLPEDSNEYIANSFINTMQKDGNYISYSTIDENNSDYYGETVTPVTWTVAKIGDSYAVRKDEFPEGKPQVTTQYFVLYISEDNYKIYKETESNVLTVDKNISFEFLSFNFNQKFRTKEENSYIFGEAENSITVTFKDDAVYSLSSYDDRGNSVNIYVKDHGADYNKAYLTFLTSTEGYDVRG